MLLRMQRGFFANQIAEPRALSCVIEHLRTLLHHLSPSERDRVQATWGKKELASYSAFITSTLASEFSSLRVFTPWWCVLCPDLRGTRLALGCRLKGFRCLTPEWGFVTLRKTNLRRFSMTQTLLRNRFLSALDSCSLQRRVDPIMQYFWLMSHAVCRAWALILVLMSPCLGELILSPNLHQHSEFSSPATVII